MSCGEMLLILFRWNHSLQVCRARYSVSLSGRQELEKLECSKSTSSRTSFSSLKR